eukprot:scaffold231108_cov32-Tisochrysis_lutea.AAC.4
MAMRLKRTNKYRKGRAMHICVQKSDTRTQRAECKGQIDSNRRLPNPSLATAHTNESPHVSQRRRRLVPHEGARSRDGGPHDAAPCPRQRLKRGGHRSFHRVAVRAHTAAKLKLESHLCVWLHRQLHAPRERWLEYRLEGSQRLLLEAGAHSRRGQARASAPAPPCPKHSQPVCLIPCQGGR